MVDLRPGLYVSAAHNTQHAMGGSLTLASSCMINSSYWVSYMSLWLKAEKYPTTLVNIYPTFVNLVQALSSWLGTTLAVTIGVKYLWSFQYVSGPGSDFS